MTRSILEYSSSTGLPVKSEISHGPKAGWPAAWPTKPRGELSIVYSIMSIELQGPYNRLTHRSRHLRVSRPVNCGFQGGLELNDFGGRLG